MEFVMGRMEEVLARMESIMGLMLSQQQSSVFGAAGPPLPPPGIATACASPGAMNAAPLSVETAPQAKATGTPQPEATPAAMTVQAVQGQHAVQPTVQAEIIGVHASPAVQS